MELAQVTLIARGCTEAQAKEFLGKDDTKVNPGTPTDQKLYSVRNGMLTSGFMRFPDESDK